MLTFLLTIEQIENCLVVGDTYPHKLRIEWEEIFVFVMVMRFSSAAEIYVVINCKLDNVFLQKLVHQMPQVALLCTELADLSSKPCAWTALTLGSNSIYAVYIDRSLS